VFLRGEKAPRPPPLSLSLSLSLSPSAKRVCCFDEKLNRPRGNDSVLRARERTNERAGSDCEKLITRSSPKLTKDKLHARTSRRSSFGRKSAYVRVIEGPGRKLTFLLRMRCRYRTRREREQFPVAGKYIPAPSLPSPSSLGAFIKSYPQRNGKVKGATVPFHISSDIITLCSGMTEPFAFIFRA